MNSNRIKSRSRGDWTAVRHFIFVGPMADESVQRMMQTVSRSTRIIAVDGGVDVLLRLNQRIDVAVGDWDSVSNLQAVRHLAERGVEVVSLSTAKDESDLHAAIRFVRESLPKRHRIERVEAYGFSKGRPDQSLAVHFDLLSAARLFQKASVVHRDSDSEAHYFYGAIKNYRFSEVVLGQTLSLFSLAPISRGVTLRGVDFPLVNADLRPSSWGLSNRVNRRSVVFNLRSGCIIAILLSDLLLNSRQNVRRLSMK